MGCRTPCCLRLSASSASFASSKKRRGLVLDSRIFASEMSWMEETTEGTAFLSAAKAPGVATIWPSSKAGCLLVCCMGKTPFVGFVFCFLEAPPERCIKSKCPSWRGEAPGRPRCQGRVVFAFIGAKRESLEKKRAVQAQVFSRKGRRRKSIRDGIYRSGLGFL